MLEPTCTITTELCDSFELDDMKFCTCAVCLYTYTSKRSLVRHVKQSKHYLQVEVPDFIKDMVPRDYEFNLCNYNVANGTFKICLPILTTKEDLRCWIHQFEIINGCKYVRKHGSRVTKSSSFEETYSCQHFRPPSKINRSKGTMCQSKIYAAVKRSPLLMYTMITVHYRHNHQLHTPYVLKFKPSPPERFEIIFENIFEEDNVDLLNDCETDISTTIDVDTTATNPITTVNNNNSNHHNNNNNTSRCNILTDIDDDVIRYEVINEEICPYTVSHDDNDETMYSNERAEIDISNCAIENASTVIDRFEMNLNLFIGQMKNYPDYYAAGVDLFNDKIEQLLNCSPQEQLSALYRFSSNSSDDIKRNNYHNPNYRDIVDNYRDDRVNERALSMDHDYTTIKSSTVPLSVSYASSDTSSSSNVVTIETVGVIDVYTEEPADLVNSRLKTLSYDDYSAAVEYID